jgi:hypothetical protein
MFLQSTVCGSMGGICSSYNVTSSDGRLSFNDFEDLLFHPHIRTERGRQICVSHSVKCCNFSESAVNRQKSATIWHPPIRVVSSVSSNSICSISVKFS